MVDGPVISDALLIAAELPAFLAGLALMPQAFHMAPMALFGLLTGALFYGA